MRFRVLSPLESPVLPAQIFRPPPPAPRLAPVLHRPVKAAPPRPSLRISSPLLPPGASGIPAQVVGISGGTGTTVAMIPAPLYSGERVDITEFTVAIDAGVY